MASPQATNVSALADEDVTPSMLLESGDRPGDRPGAIGIGRGSVLTAGLVLKICVPVGVVGQRMNSPP